MDADFERSIRTNLAPLSARIEGWVNHLRKCRLDASFVGDDWIMRFCTNDEIQEHAVFKEAFRREVLLRGCPAETLFSDQPCDSEVLNSLKAQRQDRFGAAELILSRADTRHLIELSSASRKLSHVFSRTSQFHLSQIHSMQTEASLRRDNWLKLNGLFAEEVCSKIGPFGGDRARLEERAADFFSESMSGPFRTSRISEMGVMSFSASARLSDRLDIHCIPLVRPLSNSQKGSFRLAWRIAPHRQICLDGSVVLHMSELLPLNSDHHFGDDLSAAVNVAAHLALVEASLGDIRNAFVAGNAVSDLSS